MRGNADPGRTETDSGAYGSEVLRIRGHTDSSAYGFEGLRIRRPTDSMAGSRAYGIQTYGFEGLRVRCSVNLGKLRSVFVYF